MTALPREAVMKTTVGRLPSEIGIRWDIGLAWRRQFERGVYSLTHLNVHFQDVAREFRRLGQFLEANGVSVPSAVDVGCGNGVITTRLRDLLGLQVISGIERNARLAALAREKGIKVVEGDMERLRGGLRRDLAICYGSLHHSADIGQSIRTLAALSSDYVLIVDNSVRDTWFHRITGSALFPFELSPYRIRTRDEIAAAIRQELNLVAVETFPNANVWHDRTFFLARV